MNINPKVAAVIAVIGAGLLYARQSSAATVSGTSASDTAATFGGVSGGGGSSTGSALDSFLSRLTASQPASAPAPVPSNTFAGLETPQAVTVDAASRVAQPKPTEPEIIQGSGGAFNWSQQGGEGWGA